MSSNAENIEKKKTVLKSKLYLFPYFLHILKNKINKNNSHLDNGKEMHDGSC